MKPDYDYFTMYSYATYVWVIALATWGGIANYVRKVRAGDIARFSLVELIGDVCISGFVGFMTFLLCQASKLSPELSAVLVGVSGHMGSRAIFSLERLVQRKVDALGK